MDEDVISARLHGRIRRDFPDADVAGGIAGALRVLAAELEGSLQSAERLLTAAVVIAARDVERFRSAIRLARTDWRDLLVGGGLAGQDWPRVLDEELAPGSAPPTSRTPETPPPY
nr:hypothetical protein OG999_38470 [Streptomyces sp. NBC_00886]